jgi:hypothetical protein
MAMPKKKHSSSQGYDFREHMAKAKKSAHAKKKLRGMHIEVMDDGGHTVEHHFHQAGGGMMPGNYTEPKKHAFGKHDGAKMMAHIQGALGMGGGEAEPDGDEG